MRNVSRTPMVIESGRTRNRRLPSKPGIQDVASVIAHQVDAQDQDDECDTGIDADPVPPTQHVVEAVCDHGQRRGRYPRPLARQHRRDPEGSENPGPRGSVDSGRKRHQDVIGIRPFKTRAARIFSGRPFFSRHSARRAVALAMGLCESLTKAHGIARRRVRPSRRGFLRPRLRGGRGSHPGRS